MSQLELFELTKFKPTYLHDLINDLHESPELREHTLNQILNDQNASGYFWELVLAKWMTHTSICEKRNQVGMDYKDGSDGKFAMAGRYSNSFQRQATIGGVKNKIGDLRVCMCYAGDKYHRLYFMRIPHDAYRSIKGENIKVNFTNFSPVGKWWDKYQCSWEEVIAP